MFQQKKATPYLSKVTLLDLKSQSTGGWKVGLLQGISTMWPCPLSTSQRRVATRFLGWPHVVQVACSQEPWMQTGCISLSRHSIHTYTPSNTIYKTNCCVKERTGSHSESSWWPIRFPGRFLSCRLPSIWLFKPSSLKSRFSSSRDGFLLWWR